MLWIRRGFVLVAGALLWGAPAEGAARLTHKQTGTINVPRKRGISLQTMALLPDGKIAALVAPNRHGGVDGDEANSPKVKSEVRLYDPAGTNLKQWTVNFAGQALAASPQGTLIVAGDGHLAKFDAEGTLLASADMPHLAAVLADKDALRKQAEELVESQKQAIEQSKKAFESQIRSLEKRIDLLKMKEKDGKELAPADKRRLKRYEEQLVQYKSIDFGREESLSVDAAMKALVHRARVINSVTVTANDIFVVCGDQKGHGYAAWRIDHDFMNPSKVLSGLIGCCGQMDLKADGDSLYVAENTKHRVGQYDREGKLIRSFGKRGKDGFGGCCNPMNLCIGPEGRIFTAESEGIIREFSAEGDELGMVGKVALTGGCKDVAVGVSPDGNMVYFCDQPNSRIVVMSKITDPEEAERLAKQAEPKESLLEKLGRTLSGDGEEGSENE